MKKKDKQVKKAKPELDEIEQLIREAIHKLYTCIVSLDILRYKRRKR